MHHRAYITIKIIASEIDFIFCLFNSHYTIIAPQNIRANSEYHVSVSLHDADQPGTIRISIKNDRGLSDSKEVTVEPYTTRIVQFSVGSIQFKLLLFHQKHFHCTIDWWPPPWYSFNCCRRCKWNQVLQWIENSFPWEITNRSNTNW